MLESLPCEILLLVANLLPSTSLRSLSQVSSRLHTALIQLVYQAVTFRAASEWALNVLDVDSFFLHHGSPLAARYLRHTKHLHFYAPINLARFNRCAYYSIFRTVGLSSCSSTLGTSDDIMAHEHFLDDIAGQLDVVFARLKPNFLRSFEWRLGTCLPMGILSKEGYLSKYQTRLSKLFLVTDGTCPQTCISLGGLPEFSSLTTLAWEGIQHPKEVEYLQQCIYRNSGHLTDLSIGFISSPASRAFRWDAFDSHHPKGLCSKDKFTDQMRPLSPLSTLSLSKVTLPANLSLKESVFCSLRALTLRDCTNQLYLLRCLCQAPCPLRLEHFEACIDQLLFEPGEERDFHALVDFLFSFQGLKTLYLKLTNFPTKEVTIQNAICHHQSTLRSLVYHERQLQRIDDDGLFEDDRDVMPHWIPCLADVVNLSHMTSLALCASPAYARRCLESEARNSQLQILHLRFSGPENIHRNIREDIEALLNDKQYKGISSALMENHDEYSAGVEEIFYSLSSRKYVLSDSAMKDPSRFEAEEILEFAEWAFGPTGLPSLQLLAFGDFSHEDRYPSQQFMVRRHIQVEAGQRDLAELSTRYFLSVDSTDPRVWDGVSVEGSKFIGACPYGAMMESPYDI